MENSPKSQRAVETTLTGPLMAVRLPGKGPHSRPESRTTIPGASTGLCRHETAFPAFGVTEPEAFLARWMCVVHLLAQNEESAQRPGCSRGSILGWVRDVGFRLCSHYGTRVSRLHRFGAGSDRTISSRSLLPSRLMVPIFSPARDNTGGGSEGGKKIRPFPFR